MSPDPDAVPTPNKGLPDDVHQSPGEITHVNTEKINQTGPKQTQNNQQLPTGMTIRAMKAAQAEARELKGIDKQLTALGTAIETLGVSSGVGRKTTELGKVSIN